MGLSKTYRILFIDPALSYFTVLLGRIRRQKWSFKSSLRRINERLLVYTPPAFPPFSQYFRWANFFHTRLLIFLTRRLLKRISFENFILGSGRPFMGRAVKDLNPTLSYYDCSDDYLEFPGLKANRTLLKESETDLLKSVDLVFCSSQALKEAKSPLNRNCFFLPNGVDQTYLSDQRADQTAHQAGDTEIPPDLKGIGRPLLGYVGTIGDWFDFDQLVGLAKRRPDWSFVLIGPLTSRPFSSIFQEVSNIHWLGEKHYESLHRYLKWFDLCLIPFRVDEFTKKIYPTKVHQYLAEGKSVVSSHLPELESLTPWVEFYSDVGEMEEKVEKSLRDDSEEKALARKRVAAQNTWDQRVASMVRVFGDFLRS